MAKNPAAVKLGKIGGSKKSDKKTAAARKNATKPRARLVTAVAYEVRLKEGEPYKIGVLLLKGRIELYDEKLFDLIENNEGKKVLEFSDMASVTQRV